MDNEKDKNNIDVSLEYSRMAELLKKERPPEAALMIKEILESGETLQEKIRKIELIDAQENTISIDQTAISAEEAQEIIRKKHVLTEETAKKNSEKIISKIIKTPYLFYIFKDYKKIRAFGKSAGFIKFGLNPAGMKFDYSRSKTLFNSLQKDAGELMEILNFVLDKGWMDLEKLDYNLIVIFRQLCQAIISAPYARIGTTGRQFLSRYRDVEALFLTCRYQGEYPDIIRAGVSNVLFKQKKPEGLIELSEIQIKRILGEERDAASLLNFILSINMFEYRKFLKLDDLIKRQSGGIVNTFSYDCPPNIQLKINVYINDRMQTWKNLLKDKAEINRIQYFLKHFIRQDSTGYRSYNFNILMDFYNYSGLGAAAEDSFSYDKGNTAKLALNFFTKFLNEFENFFIDKIGIEDFGPLRVFSREVFQLEVDKLRQAVLKFTDSIFTLPIVSRREFFDLKTSKKEVMPAPPVLTMIQTIDALDDILSDIGTKLGNIHINYKRPAGEYVLGTPVEPLEIAATWKREVSVPFWDKKILTPGYLKDKYFSDAVATITSLCFLSDVYFYNMRFYAVLEKEMKINNMILDVKKNIERLADVVTFEKIRKIQNV
ncbi:MAG: hypothetical protein ABSG94_10900 [Brevinematales bacterium]|jgi:hypothetical protein